MARIDLRNTDYVRVSKKDNSLIEDPSIVYSRQEMMTMGTETDEIDLRENEKMVKLINLRDLNEEAFLLVANTILKQKEYNMTYQKEKHFQQEEKHFQQENIGLFPFTDGSGIALMLKIQNKWEFISTFIPENYKQLLSNIKTRSNVSDKIKCAADDFISAVEHHFKYDSPEQTNVENIKYAEGIALNLSLDAVRIEEKVHYRVTEEYHDQEPSEYEVRKFNTLDEATKDFNSTKKLI